jgi:hypothetical protein
MLEAVSIVACPSLPVKPTCLIAWLEVSSTGIFKLPCIWLCCHISSRPSDVLS